MKHVSRRIFLAASAAAAATPVLAAPRPPRPAPPPAPEGPPRSGFVDVVVVGAGAAGIAAARRLAAAGKRFALIEAADEIGGRYAREGEMEDFLAGLVRATTAISDAARKGDIAAAQVLPKELGDWRAT